MMSYLVEDLVHKDKINEAKGIYLRHHISHIVRPDVKEVLDKWHYDPKKEAPHHDEFAPLSKP